MVGLQEIVSRLSRRLPRRPLDFVVSGMFLIAAGQKRVGAPMWLAGLVAMESKWRAAHPEFRGGVRERLRLAIAFHDEQHQSAVNRALHVVGVPMIIGGLVGLLVVKPYRLPWLVCSTSFTVGWGLNLVGHAVEGKRPALATDPVAAYIAGPWIYILERWVAPTAASDGTCEDGGTPRG